MQDAALVSRPASSVSRPASSPYELTHLSDSDLLRELEALVARDRVTTAELIAHIAEVDARKLYAPAGHSSMIAYCIEELRLSEDAAYKRIQAARAARSYPILFEALADGRLHLAAVCLLAAHLAADNVDELVEAATHRKKADIEIWLAQRFGTWERPPISSIRPVTTGRPGSQLAPGQAEGGVVGDLLAPGQADEVRSGPAADSQLAPGQVDEADTDPASHTQLAPGQVEIRAIPQQFILQVTISSDTRKKLLRLQALLSHAVPSGDLAQVLDRAVEIAVEQIEKRKLGSCNPTPSNRPNADRPRADSSWRRRTRYIPTPVRRAVWERDEGQCTFVTAAGHRCTARQFLEFDHVEPFARGGKASVEGLRLRCRAHNQYEAEQSFGAEFMRQKRETQDVVAGLRSLGCRADEARRAAEASQTHAGATLEERMQIALGFLGQRHSALRTSASETAKGGQAGEASYSSSSV